MKIYFTASLTGKKLYEENYKKIVFCLRELDCNVFTSHIFHKSREQVRNEDKKSRFIYHQLLNKNIKWCDAVVSEVSYPSTSVGYEISLAVKKGKPVIALYFEKEGDYPPILQALARPAYQVVL